MSGQNAPYGPGPADGQGASPPLRGPGDYSAQSSTTAGPVASGPSAAAGGYGPPPAGAPAYGQQPGYGSAPTYGPPPGYGAAPGYGQGQGYGGGPGYGAGPGYGGGPAYGAGPGYGVPADQPGSVDVVGTRVGQYIVDLLCAAVPYIVVMILGGVLSTVSGTLGAIVFFLGYLVALVSGFAVYAWWPSTHGGQTPGMGWLGLKVVREEDGGEPTLGQHALRWLLLIIDAAFFGIVGLIIMSTSQRKQRLGDMAAHTLVVRV
jgi:uncharacterized RDD family membrane protein YckC